MASAEKDKNSDSRNFRNLFVEEIPRVQKVGESFWRVFGESGDSEIISGDFLVNRKAWNLFLPTFWRVRKLGNHKWRLFRSPETWNLFVESFRTLGKSSTNVFAESGFRKNPPETCAAFSGSPKTFQKRAALFASSSKSAVQEIQLGEI
ncbi:MAG: hypothetical protein JWM68_5509 [Verrucomicrobiales bacterium]|nr:hypothetical protein [Verrucomicrobiales bacterium]